MNNHLLSIIIPVYNVEKFLARCLDSLVNQTFNNIELIIVNDGSTDNSQAIIDQYSQKYPSIIRSFIKKNGGLSDARNFGLKHIKGDLVAFVDSDDYIDIEMYSRMVNQLEYDNSDLVICNYYTEEIQQGIKKQKDAIIDKSFKKKIYTTEDKERILFYPTACNKVFRRRLFDDLQFPYGVTCEDLATTPRIMLNAEKISYIDKAYYYYQIDNINSITNQLRRENKNANDLIIVLSDLIPWLKKHSKGEYKSEIDYLIIEHISNRFGICSQLPLMQARKHMEVYLSFYKKNAYQEKILKNKYLKFSSYKNVWRVYTFLGLSLTLMIHKIIYRLR